MNIIETKDLVKKYGENIAVDSINLSINKGEIYGLLGPNGAGKSTIINMLCSILKPTNGSLKVFGVDIKSQNVEMKKRIGLVPQNVAVYKDFTAYENVKLFGQLYGLKGKKLNENIKNVLEIVGLLDKSKEQAKNLSEGMRRRLNLACAIVHEPELVIIDEPTIGADKYSKKIILNAIKRLNIKGTTIIYTTNYMEEAEMLCSKIGIIDKGKILVEGTVEELKSIVSDKNTLQVAVDDVYELELEEIKNTKGVSEIILDKNSLTINSKKEINNLDLLIKSITESNAQILNFKFKEITLDTVFLTLTGRSLIG